MKRSLVVGALGQVGQQIVRVLGAEHVVPASRAGALPGEVALDLAELADRPERASGLVRELDVEAIYCAAAMTHVDGCESQPEMAMKVNCYGPAALAAASAEAQVPFIFFSSDYVFDGRSGPYREDDVPNPISVYGRSKWEGEIAARKTNRAALILRTTGVYGFDAARKNFLYGLRRACVEGRRICVATDQISTPTYNRDLAEAAVRLARKRASGIFHVAGPDRMSRYDFAIAVARAMGWDSSCVVGKVTGELGQTAPRPLSAGLVTEKLCLTLADFRMRNVEEGVREWLAEDPPQP